MAEEGGGNLLNEFKAAKPPEKAVIIFGIIAVIGVAFYLYRRGVAASAATPASGSAGSSGQVAGYPTAGGVPVLPSGVNPLYDPNGNIVAFQNPGGGTGTPPLSGGGSTTSPNWFATAFGAKPEISNQNGKFLLVERGAGNKIMNVVDLSTLFPSGTTFNGASGGQAFANVPGNSPLLLTNGGYGRPTLIASSTTVAKTAAGGTH